MSGEADDGAEEPLKAALWFSIGKVVDEETLKLGVNATPQFIGALTELVWAQIENVAGDLESFSKYSYSVILLNARLIFSRHASRSTISVDDVLLLARRNEGLEAVLRNSLERLGSSKSKASKKK